MKPFLAAATMAALALATPAPAQESRRVLFAPGTDSAAIDDVVTGRAYLDHVLGAAEGQTMAVSLVSQDASASFNILPPGSDDVAIYIGSVAGPVASVVLPESGDYTIRVYLMGNARDTGATIPFTLSMTIR